MRADDDPADIVIITALSGAGRSTAAKSLEDLGWFVVDNLPPGLLPTMVDLAARSNGAVTKMAAVVDVRSRAFSTDLKSAISDLGARRAAARVVYLEAADDTLVRRFDSERRPHPLQGTGRVTDGIAAERELLREVRGDADLVLDTSRLNVHELRARMRDFLAVPPAKKSRILARSSCTLSREVSSTRSASPRTSRSSSRSAAMPSVTRPVPCSGCGRRSLSNLRTSVSSAASRYTTRAAARRAPRSLMADFRSVLNARLRTSTTAAILVTAPLDLAARSTIVGSRPGGRLSTTNQPRSSSDLAAVDRPAPDSPVMITMSAGSSSARFALRIRMQRRQYRAGE